jgi:hypothetical protein
VNARHHLAYIFGSIASALIASAGILAGTPFLYGLVPGLIGGVLTAVAAYRFLKEGRDLAGFIATLCGFVYYQAFQANPVALPFFGDLLIQIPIQDQVAGLFFANLTTAFLLIGYYGVGKVLGFLIAPFVSAPSRVGREQCDGVIMIGFWLIFVVVALPNVLFGQVIVGPIHSILYQRLAWSDAAGYSGYLAYGGALGASFANVGLWSISLFIVWFYLLGSRHRILMLVVGPLVIIWTAAVAFQGSRTFIVALGIATIVYYFGRQRTRSRAYLHVLWIAPVLFVAIQVMTIFRTTGLQSFDAKELSTHFLDLQGNEGASSEMDGMEYFRTELAERGAAPNPLTGFLRGMVGRPVEGALMIVPRPIFPWKAEDTSGLEFNLFFQRVRLGQDLDEAFLGASPGLIGRELIKYGYLGPLTLMFWMGFILALADRLYSIPGATDFHRLFGALLIAFFVAQARDFQPVWFIPFVPGALLVLFVVLRSRQTP